MKQIYYITFSGHYVLSPILGKDEVLSKRRTTFSTKDTCTDFKPGGIVSHKGRFLKIDTVVYEKIPGAFR